MLAESVVRAACFPVLAEEEEIAAAPSTPPVVDEAALTREAARREGLMHGRDEGRAEALADWAPRLAALAAALEQAIAVARTERERLAAEIADTVPHVAVQLARKVIERELSEPEQALRTVVDGVARRIAQGGVAAVRVAPDVAEALAAWRRESEEGAALAGVTVHADDTLQRGDWIIETDAGFLDGRLSTQLEEAGRLLTEIEG